MRFCANADHARQDIMPALATRFASVTAAELVLDLADTIRRCWPEPFIAGRPCCMRMTPDERTLGRLAKAAMWADRSSFDDELDGFVRPVLREPLFNSSVRAVAQFMAL
jgi:hypothetical protein